MSKMQEQLFDDLGSGILLHSTSYIPTVVRSHAFPQVGFLGPINDKSLAILYKDVY